MKEMKLRLRKNIIPWLRDQLSRPLWFRNFFITRNAWITILAYCILGKDIKALMGKVGDVDCPIYQQT